MLDPIAVQVAKIVPGIPLAALSAIADPNIRDVLQALVDTHHVRNNQAGSGNEQFITVRQALALASSGALNATATPYQVAAFAGGMGDSTVYGPGALSGTAHSLSFTLDMPGNVMFQAIWESSAAPGSHCNSRIQLIGNSGLFFDTSQSCHSAFVQSHCVSTVQTLAAGPHLLSAYFGNDYTAGSYTLGRWGILMLPVA